MSTATAARRTVKPLRLGPADNGLILSNAEFEAADFVGGWRYELINGVLIVSPRPAAGERDPNEELGVLLRNYGRTHPEGHVLLATLSEQEIQTKRSKRAADRVIWIGPPRVVDEHDVPTIVVEFPSERPRDRRRDYETKCEEYGELGIKEYWIIDRHQRCMTIVHFRGSRVTKRVIQADEEYATPLLPGFVVPLKRLLELADRWATKKKPKRR
jgi:Uma2 family endonuclease